MSRIQDAIEKIRPKIDGLRKRSLKETPTRIIVVDPMLEALGWDVRDPDEVEMEYPTVDGKSVDYALKINKKAVLLVEAKPLDDPLNDVKWITQVVGYAANDGIAWCVLTNGLKWRVYRSVEQCPAPDKLMFEVSLDPRDADDMPVEQIAEQLWRFSRDQMARGTLDALGEQTFTDAKVRKALDAIMPEAPRNLVNIIRKATGDGTLPPQRIKESLRRIWSRSGISALGGEVAHAKPAQRTRSTQRVGEAVLDVQHPRRPVWPGTPYDESHHTTGKAREVLELYRAIDRICLSLKPDGIERRYLAKVINYDCGKRAFCSVHIQQGGLRVWLRLKYGRLQSPPSFARDVSGVGHWGNGDLELRITSLSQISESAVLVRESFEGCLR